MERTASSLNVGSFPGVERSVTLDLREKNPAIDSPSVSELGRQVHVTIAGNSPNPALPGGGIVPSAPLGQPTVGDSLADLMHRDDSKSSAARGRGPSLTGDSAGVDGLVPTPKKS